MVVRLVRGFYNEQNNTVNVIHYDDNTIISLDCGKWEQGLRTTPNSQGKMDALAIDDPIEYEYFERIMDLTYENGNLKAENQELKRENSRLREKLEKAYDFMRQFTIGGMNMLEKFLRSIGEWVQQKVAGLSR